MPHHLIDIVWPGQDFSVAAYVEAARTRGGRNRRPWPGGALRRRHAALSQGAAARHRRWVRRPIGRCAPRLVEWGREAGPPHSTSDWPRSIRRRRQSCTQATPAGWCGPWRYSSGRVSQSAASSSISPGRTADECRVFVLDWPRDQLYARIDRRVEAMFAAGLIDEVQRLLDAGRRFGRTASQAVGYREVLQHLEGQRDLAATVELVQQRTRQFARRQLTWFRSLSECRTVPTTEDGQPIAAAEIARRIAASVGGGQQAAGSGP